MRPRCGLETLLGVCSLPILYILMSQIRLMLLQSSNATMTLTNKPQVWKDSSNKPVEEAWSSNHDLFDCTKNECSQQFAESLARVWTQKPLDTWCRMGRLVLIKVPKSASSTATGMVLRLGQAFNCSVSWEHGKAREKLFDMSSPRFVVAPIRLPHTRALSDIYFHKVTFHTHNVRGDSQPGDAFIKTQLDQVPANYVLEYTRVDNGTALPQVLSQQWPSVVVQEIMAAYDFLLVVERMEESMIVLAWILQVPVTALVTFSSKQADSWYLVGNKNKHKCVRLVKPALTSAIQATLESESWRRRHNGDLLLHAAANKSLDLTIDAIGRATVMQGVEHLRRIQATLEMHCANQTHFPCSSSGRPQLELSRASCIERDFGCGYACVDRLFGANDMS